MTDGRRLSRIEAGVEPDPKANADKLRGISQDALAQARAQGQTLSQAGIGRPQDVPQSELGNLRSTPVSGGGQSAPASREQFIEKEGVGHPSGGYGNTGTGQQQNQGAEKTVDVTAKQTEQGRGIKPAGAENTVAQAKTGNASEKAVAPEVRNVYEANQKALNQEARSMKGEGVKDREGESGQARAAPTPNPKAQEREGPSR
jgi:hypothetical protein